PLAKLCQAGGHIALRSSRPAGKDIRHGEVIGEAMAAAQLNRLPPAFERRAAIAPENVQHRGIVERDRLAERVAHPLRRRHCFCGVTICRSRVFPVPRQMRQVGTAKDANIRPGEQRQHGFRRTAVCADGRGHMVERRFQLAQMKQGIAAGWEEYNCSTTNRPACMLSAMAARPRRRTKAIASRLPPWRDGYSEYYREIAAYL